MKRVTRNNIKDYFADGNFNRAKISRLIDELWRDELWLYNESKLSAAGRVKIDPLDLVNYDERYVYALNDFREVDESLVTSWAAAIGFGNTLRADFSKIYGYGNTATSFAEIIIGTYGTLATGQTRDAWVVTDRLLTLANGADADNPSDVFNIFKSGFLNYYNAICIGDYSNGGATPPNGTFRFYNDVPQVYIDGWVNLVGNIGITNFTVQSGYEVLSAGTNTVSYDEVFDESVTGVTVIPFVRRISDNAVIDFVLGEPTNSGFPLTVWEDAYIYYIAAPKGQTVGDIGTAIDPYMPPAGIKSLDAGTNTVSFTEQADTNFNPYCNAYDSEGNAVVVTILWTSFTTTSFQVSVPGACTLRWTIIKHRA